MAQPEAAPSTVVVEGRRPGPGLWKVSRDGHVMWVFGLYSPLPKKLEWDASRVERLVAKSQEVLTPPGAEAHVGVFKALTLLPSMRHMIGIRNNPDGATLQAVVPADVYARWTVLKAKYIGGDEDVERLRPIFAAQRLMRAGRDRNGLSTFSEVREQIVRIAKKNKVKLRSTGIELPLDNVGQALKDFKQNRLEDVACFTKSVDTLEPDLDSMRVRANAWANGNIAEIRSIDFSEREDACDDAILHSSVAQTNPELRSLRERLRANWLEVAEKALADNETSFAMLDMKHIVDQKGYLAALQARGYTVESPK